jgi:hypothetical protein
LKGLTLLPVSQQNKLKANINQLWLERMPTSEIITTAGGLFNSMQGPSMREIIVDNFAGGGASPALNWRSGVAWISLSTTTKTLLRCIRRITRTRCIIASRCLTLIQVAATSGKPVGLAWFSPTLFQSEGR